MIDDATLNEWAAVFDDYHRVHAGQCTCATRAVERRLSHMVPLLIAEVWRLREPMPCGHPVTAVSSSAEGTNCCGMCVLKADRDRLRCELDDTKAQLEACEIWRDKLRVEAAKARQSCTECPNCDRLQRELVAKGKP